MKALALQYAEAGYHVLATHTIVKDQSNNELTCTCWGKICKNGKSAGKHPLSNISPHGALSGTTDVKEIQDKWPEDGFNLGIALSDELMVLDVDDETAARNLLDMADELRDVATVQRTGRGLQIFLAPSEPMGPCNLTAEDGRKIGELRGAGLYVVVAPSMHKLGRRYAWLGTSLLEGGPTNVQGTAWDYAKRILGSVGVQMRAPSVTGEADEALLALKIDPIEMPFTIPREDMMLRQLTRGYPPGNDRSGVVFKLVCETIRVAKKVNYPITDIELCGVVKQVDDRYYKKFTDRSDGDKQIKNAVTRARESVATERKSGLKGDTVELDQTELPPQSATVDADGASLIDGLSPEPGTPESVPESMYDYDWDEENQEFVDRTARQPKRVCNFEPVIVEMLTVWNGENEQRDEWSLVFRKKSRSVSIRLKAEDRDDRSFRTTVARKLPPEFIVEPGCWEKLKVGMQHYSKDKNLTVERTAYAASGWLPDQDAFLLPSALGVITPHGIDESISFDSENAPPRLLQYGAGVTPPTDPETLHACLDALYSVITSPEVSIPLLMQMWAAPMASLGIGNSCAVVHLHARTGSYKTSVVRAMMSLYGRFIDSRKDPIDSWTGTAKSIQESLSYARDLPFLMDDYKAQNIRSSEITTVLQNYADRTTRSRLRRDGTAAMTAIPTCLLISTGEDIWDSQESTLARTIRLELKRESVDIAALSEVQRMARDGQLQTLGYAWLHWLTCKGKAYITERLGDSSLSTKEQKYAEAMAEIHPRTASSIVALMAADQIFLEFVKEVVPKFRDRYWWLREMAWAGAVESAKEMATFAKEFSPWEAMKSAISEAITVGSGCLKPRLADGVYLGLQGSEPIGFIDHEAVYLNNGITFGWHLRTLAQQRLSPTFSWLSFLQEAKKSHGAETSRIPTYVHEGPSGGMKLVKIPTKEIFPENELETINDTLRDILD